MSLSNAVIWLIAAATTMAILFRPWRLPEYVWATAGAVALVALGLLPAAKAGSAILEGTDVYLFLISRIVAMSFCEPRSWLVTLSS